ncbi:MAG: hypothetical protein IKZ39_03000 [Lachnospiraceae bacterium]|nr:hypothetical protein [Lachnospiraceae bacterium]MBR5896565.1 hypothetical protein [Lachnospiraceae bacterium]
MPKSKSALFLMELIIVILFFALTSAVCMRVFIKAHDVAHETESANYAVLWADNAAECFYEFGGAGSEEIKSTLASAFNLPDYSYSLDFSADDDYEYMTFTFTYTPKSEEIYKYTFKRHIKEVS